jgi:hypothetical protein
LVSGAPFFGATLAFAFGAAFAVTFFTTAFFFGFDAIPERGKWGTQQSAARLFFEHERGTYSSQNTIGSRCNWCRVAEKWLESKEF